MPVLVDGSGQGVWRVAENDPDSELYAVSRDADTVIRFMAANS
jgi:hypothetical protein